MVVTSHTQSITHGHQQTGRAGQAEGRGERHHLLSMRGHLPHMQHGICMHVKCQTETFPCESHVHAYVHQAPPLNLKMDTSTENIHKILMHVTGRMGMGKWANGWTKGQTNKCNINRQGMGKWMDGVNG